MPLCKECQGDKGSSRLSNEGFKSGGEVDVTQEQVKGTLKGLMRLLAFTLVDRALVQGWIQLGFLALPNVTPEQLPGW